MYIKMKKIVAVKHVIVSFITLISIWQIVYVTSHFNEALFPSPLHAWKALVQMVIDGSIFVHIGTSMYRFAVGYISAIVVAVLLGLLLGWFTGIFNYVNPIIQLLRPISPMDWMQFIVLIAAFFPVLLSTVSAVSGVNPIYLKVSKNFGVGQPHILWKVVFPAAFPQIANGIHLALGTAWVFLVAGEMTGAQSGLGYQIIDARNNLESDTLLATIVVIGFLGILLDALLKVIEKRVLRSWGGVA